MDNKLDKKEQWADEVLQSLGDIQRAAPNANLFEKISQHLPKEKVNKFMPLKRLGWVAAAACLIIAANVYLPSKHANKHSEKTVAKTTLLTDYSIY